MKLLLISLDLIVALPIASAAILLLFGSLSNAGSYMAASARSQAMSLSIYYKSELLVTLLSNADLNYTSAIQVAGRFSEVYGVNSTLVPLAIAENQSCSGSAACRVVTISSISYLVTVSD